MKKSTYSFTTADKQEIIVDLRDEHWNERWFQYSNFRRTLGPPNRISEDLPEEVAIPKLIEIYDKKLLSIYDKEVSLSRKNEMIKFYTSFEHNLNKKLERMKSKGASNPLLNLDYLKDVEDFKKELSERKEKYNSQYSKDPLYAWIFNFYNLILVTSKNDDSGKRLFNTRLQKYLDVRKKGTYTKLAEVKDAFLLEALAHVSNPQMTIDHSDTKYLIADFLCNFENCYSEYISKPRFHYEEDDEGGIRTMNEKIQRIVRDTYAKNTKEKLLDRLGIAFDEGKKKYYYK